MDNPQIEKQSQTEESGQTEVLKSTPNVKLVYDKQRGVMQLVRELTYYQISRSRISQQLLARQHIKSDYLIAIYAHEFQKAYVNASSNTEKDVVRIFYENFDQSLKDEFLTHLNDKAAWTESQLINTLKPVLQGVADLHSMGITHGDIRMQNIVINKQNQIKLADQFALSISNNNAWSSENIEKTVEAVVMTQAYLSPESMKIIKSSTQKLGASRQMILTNENDFWSVGIIFLELAFVEPLHTSIYNWDDLQINFQQLKTKLGELQGLYPQLYKVLEVLLSITPKNRLRCRQIIEQIEKFAQQEEDEENRDSQRESCAYQTESISLNPLSQTFQFYSIPEQINDMNIAHLPANQMSHSVLVKNPSQYAQKDLVFKQNKQVELIESRINNISFNVESAITRSQNTQSQFQQYIQNKSMKSNQQVFAIDLTDQLNLSNIPKDSTQSQQALNSMRHPHSSANKPPATTQASYCISDYSTNTDNSTTFFNPLQKSILVTHEPHSKPGRGYAKITAATSGNGVDGQLQPSQGTSQDM